MPANTGTDTGTNPEAATRSERLDALLAAHAADLVRIKELGESLDMNKLSSKFLAAERRRAIARLRRCGVPTWAIAASTGLSATHVSVMTHRAHTEREV